MGFSHVEGCSFSSFEEKLIGRRYPSLRLVTIATTAAIIIITATTYIVFTICQWLCVSSHLTFAPTRGGYYVDTPF